MRALAALCAVAAFAALALGGAAPFGRVMMAAGVPGLAALVLDDPAWRGAALYRAGDPDRAAAAFRQAGELYNLGTAEAHAERYAAALEAYDVAILRGDPDAQSNFDVVAAFYAGLSIDPEALSLFGERQDGEVEESFIARGNARAAGTGSEVTNANTMMGLAQLQSTEQTGVRRIFDDKFMVADERWLEQLKDVPGAFMKARIREEQKRRAALGLSPPKPEDPQ